METDPKKLYLQRLANLSRQLSNPERFNTNYDAVLGEIHTISGQSALISNRPLKERVELGYQTLKYLQQDATAGVSQGLKAAEALAPQRTKIPTNRLSPVMKSIITNPEAHGLNEAGTKALLESFSYVSGAPHLDPRKYKNINDYKEATLKYIDYMDKMGMDWDKSVAVQSQYLEQMKQRIVEVSSFKDAPTADMRTPNSIRYLSELNHKWRNIPSSKSSTSNPANSAIDAITTKIGSALGGPAGILAGKAIAQFLKSIASSIAVFLARNSKIIEGTFAAGALGAGFLFGGPIGGLIAFGTMLLANPRMLRNLGMVLAAAVTLLFSFSIAAIATPIIVGGFTTIILIAFIFFIITSGAYIVPPSSGQIGGGVIGNGEKINCFNFTGPWSEADLEIERQVVDTMALASGYMSQLCEAGEIIVEFNPNQAYSWSDANRDGVRQEAELKPYGGFAAPGNRIIIYPIGVLSVRNALYTLAHESGHIFQRRQAEIMRDFADDASVRAEGFLCTYPLGQQVIEDFPELISLYYSANPTSAYRNLDCGPFARGLNLRTGYPAHWQFARDRIFGEDLWW